MREIKFRGKDISTGEWRYGSYIYQPVFASAFPQDGRTPPKETATRIYMPETFERDPKIYSVDPATVGQYTGLRDAKGVEIYEGDVLQKQWSNGEITYIRVVFREGTFIAHQWYKIDNELSCTECTLRNIDIPTTCVINNVHDAPELLTPKDN